VFDGQGGDAAVASLVGEGGKVTPFPAHLYGPGPGGKKD
jgi:hypothetical protein